MNALDLLVDFAALVSTSDMSTHLQEGRKNSSSPIRKAIQVPSFHAGPSDAEQFRFVEEAPRHNSAYTFTVDPPSPLQTFCAPTDHWHNFTAGRHDIYNMLPCYTQREDDAQQISDGYMQQDSRLSLPYQVASGEPQARAQYEISSPWGMRYGNSYAIPSEAEMWYGPRARQTYHSTHGPETQFVSTSGEVLSSEPQCNDSICQCRPPNLQCDYSANNVRPAWDVGGSPFDLDAWHRYNEWALASGGGEQYEGR